MLPRLKYHNPSVSMNVDRSMDQSTSPTLTLFYHSSSPSSPVPATPMAQSDPDAIVKTIDMKDRRDDDIWESFVALTGAQEVEATEEDRAMMLELEEQNAQSKANSVRQKEQNRLIKREEELLKQAKIDAATDTD